ncbi:MAG TPA: TerC/Alx family metal homeostasis membrane protein [Acidobacteriaceae bacterium]|nr:TerC/Alx family metal homeostasis membrane protein [Acidobacteriaceae bacterium]
MTPLSHWIGFHAALLALLALEWLMARRVRDPHRRALYATVLWVSASFVFAAFVWRTLHAAAATQYLAGYAIEEALSVDNLFVFLLLFRLFNIPEGRQQKVLFWGVLGAMVMRGAFIAAGIGLLERFAWVEYVFGALLLIGAIRLLLPESPEKTNKPPAWLAWLTRVHPVSPSQASFLKRENGILMPTVMLLALVAVELTDVVFALDSIPAVLSITRTPFLAYSSNIMAVMGLRSLYVLLAAMLTRLRFLHYGLAATLGFAALKMLTSHWIPVGPLTSLLVVVVLLGITVAVSLLAPGPERAQTQ